MNEYLLKIFCGQISIQCEFVIRASSNLDAAIKQQPRRDVNYCFFNIQALLSAAANIAKALWGQGSPTSTSQDVIARRRDREPLRIRLNVLDTSPLRNLAMRNHYDHFDERLDDWWRNSRNHNFADMMIDTAFGGDGIDDKPDILRSFDTKTNELCFWGDRFHLVSIVDEARRIRPLAIQELMRRSPLAKF